MTKQQTIQIIEVLASDDYIESLQYKDFEGKATKTEKKLLDKLGAIYRLAHLHSGCKNGHQDWREEMEKYLELLKD